MTLYASTILHSMFDPTYVVRLCGPHAAAILNKAEFRVTASPYLGPRLVCEACRGVT